MTILAMLALAIGAVLVVGMTGLLAFLIVHRRRRDMWWMVIGLDLVGAALMAGPLWWFMSTIGPCNDPMMC